MEIKKFVDQFRSFNRFYANLLSRFDKTLYGTIFSLVESNVVTEIFENGPISSKSIVESLDINKSQLSKLLSKLEKEGVLCRIDNVEDNRSQLLKLTPKGKEMHLKQVSFVQKELVKEMNTYTAQERDILSSTMTSFVNTIKKNQSVKLRKAVLKDMGFIADLHCKIYTRMGYKENFQKYVFLSLAKYMEDHLNGVSWIANVNGVDVGSISLVPSDEGWQVRWFVIDTNYQGYGIGKKLVNVLMEYAGENNIDHMHLWTVGELGAARSLYDRAGFKLVNSKKNKEWKDSTIIEEKWEF
ncbi:bifunctional helix-turn-helix transcriptional regulator/GNAT family N-acetyltransferase [Enterococcus sp. AZ163]|uniref:bifunctional helix-turn-helix transcriptional regulator/GNAT family N-acetyltransferase n=1 Tax=Enterococcus sp. AZ163 TaxID=2774638 RepID=UPI003D270576